MRIASLWVLCVTVLLAGSAAGAKFNKVVDIGDPCPRFEDLAGTDGKTHSLEDYADAPVLVLAFTCNHCPIAKLYEERFIEFTKAYGAKGVTFVAVSVSLEPSDTLEKMKERAEKSQLPYDYLHDPSQALGKALGATCTPHVFVFDKERKIAFMGSFDDHLSREKVTRHYAVDAVNALLEGKQPEIRESRQNGCPIDYKGR